MSFRIHSEQLNVLFKNRMSEIDFETSLSGDLNEQVVKFNDAVNSLYCDVFPLKVKYLSMKRLNKPWLTSGLIKSIKIRSE